MAATNFTPISLYYSTTASAVPSAGNLVAGELALNTADMKLYAKNSAGTVTLLASNAGASGSVTSVSGTGTVNGLTLTGTVTTSGSLTLGGTLSLVSPPPIGSTTPNTGAFSSLTVNGGLLFNANGDSSSGSGEIKQLTGSGLTIYSKTGSSYDFTLLNAGGSNLIRNPTGTSTLEIPQANAWFTTTGLGIGTSSTAATLTVAHASGVDGRGIRLVNSSNSQTWENRIGVQALENTAYAIKDITAGAVRFLINTVGNVGIGTTQPLAPLDVVGSSGIRVNEDGVGTKVITIRSNYAGVDPAINVTTNNSLLLLTNNTQRFVIGTVGQFGIGATPSYGNAGEVLTSGGASAAPTWAAAGGGSQAFVAFGSTGGL
jgi:hypothetical protein